MLSNRFAFVVLLGACVAAAAGGSYLATRQNAAEFKTVSAEGLKGEPASTTPGQSALSPAQPASEAESRQVANAPASARAVDRTVSQVAKASKSNAPSVAGSQRSAVLPASPAPSENASTQLPPSPPVAAAPPIEQPAPAARQDETPAEPVRVPEAEKAPEKSFTELVVASDSVIGLQMETMVTSERARVEDRVDARVIRDVRVNGQVAIPAGAHAIGTVMAVDRGGKFKERARLGIRFNTLVLADGTKLPVTTETIYRYGDPPSNSSAAKVGGGAVGGAILGAILGGAKGAAIGAAAGAGGGAVAVQAGDPSLATFASGAQLTARFLAPVTVTVEK